MQYIMMGISMAMVAMLNLSCERDTWLTDDYTIGTGEPVQIRLSYQTPASDVVVSTRSMNSYDEHDVQDLYVMVFKRPTSGEGNLANWERVNKTNVASSYFDTAALADAKKNYRPENGDWNSVTDSGVANATYGTVVVGAATTQCLIYAVANVAQGEDYNRASGSLKADLDAIDDAGDLYALEASLNVQSLLSRDDRELLMSGVFVNNNQKSDYNSNYLRGPAGLVDLSTSGPVTDVNVVDLTSLGVIKLRRLSSHITFEIEIGDYFSDFKPESWQVVNVPKKTKMMDEGDEAMSAANRITQDEDFTNSPLQTTMLHSEGKYYFDFYMFENHKQAKNTDDNWYLENYGLNIPATKQPSSDTDCMMLTKYANVAGGEELFKYAKRELEQKVTLGAGYGKVIWNTSSGTKTNPTEEEQLQGSKQFVYVEPNATYVVIKGRLLLNNQSMRNLTLPDNSSNRVNVEAAYADVTYVVHLGYARDKNIADEMAGNSGSADYKLQDFNSLRNTNYTYKIKIDGLNSIYTHVIAEGDDVETSKLMPGASGHFGLVTNDVYNVDCHYNAFVMSLKQSQVENFYYEISTPFSSINSMEHPDHNTSDPDFSWIKVRFNGVEKGGNYWNNVDDGVTNAQLVQPYKKDVSDASNNAYNGRLYNLKQMKDFIDANKGSWATIEGSSAYNVYFSVYLDEYFYDNPPMSQDGTWGNTPLNYWHYFVNKSARYVSFGNTTTATSFTKDRESSIIEPQLMIVQQSIQTHYSTMSADGFGVEHDNETPNPRWYVVDANDAIPHNPSTAFSATNGWYNTWRYVKDVPWSTYVASTVDTKYHNLNMVASTGANGLTPSTVAGEADGNTDNPYKASAIRLCMNRNRDENGNGKIDKNELKWYLPSSSQLGFVALCHFSYYDPLLDYNSLYGNSIYSRDDTYGNTYIILPEMTDLTMNGYDTSNGTKYTAHTYVTSDYKKIATHEMINTKSYDFSNTSARPGQLRCVRNLGIEVDDQETTSPREVYQFANNRFDLSYIESRSLRSDKAMDRELEPSTHFSEGNRPYKYFRVAQDTVYIKKQSYGWGDYVMLHDALTTDKNPCRKYKDASEPESARGSWRVPNLSELALMLFHDSNKQPSDPTILPLYKGRVFVCNTVWSFTPSATVWGRAFTTRNEDNVWTTTLTNAYYSSGHWKETYTQNDAVIRCVKDIDSGS